jgi:hypothetical protein
MNDVQIDKIRRSLPSTWNELTSNQFLFVSRLFQGKLTIADFKVRALLEFLSIKRKAFKRIDPEDAHFLCETLDFLTKEVSLTRNVIPVIRSGLRKYYGPAYTMTSCTFGEFTLASSVLDEYQKSGSEDHLDQLVAILYRPNKTLWFIRKHFTDHQDPRVRLMNRSLKKRAGQMAKVDYCIKHSVFLFFSGILNSLTGLYPYVYRRKDEANDQDNGWATLIISIADGKTDDNSLETVMNSNLYNVFIGLNNKAKEYQDYLDKIESHGRH